MNRKTISAESNIWYNSKDVTQTDLQLEQDYNAAIDSAIIENHVGSGILANSLIDNVIFDSKLVSGFLDGVALLPQSSISDTNLGSQLEITLKNSNCSGKRRVKIFIFGLNFESQLQYELFTFHVNESQISKKHFSQVLFILINDCNGPENVSLNLGGEVLIKEAKPMFLSRSPKMISQEFQPNILFRDVFVTGFNSFFDFLQASLINYDISELSLNTSSLQLERLDSNDVVTQVGQKFLAKTNNIQKISVLLSVENLDIGFENELDWSGDLILTIYELQSSTDCPNDIAPDLEIEFSPSNIPLAQLSFNYSSLLDNGIELDENPQPVDFAFSNTGVANGLNIIEGKYYAFTLKRSGAANKCNILISSGIKSNYVLEDTYLTNFTGNFWVDLIERDLWFVIWTDSAKLTDGQAYDDGIGISLPKIIENNGEFKDFCLDNLSFSTNDTFRALLQSSFESRNETQDERTFNTVFSTKLAVPEVRLLNSLQLANLENNNTILLGAIADRNKKFLDISNNIINFRLHSSTIINNSIFIKVIDDTTDTIRYNQSVLDLVSILLNNDLLNNKIIINTSNPNIFYRISKAELCSSIYGDVDGDGIVSDNDLSLINDYLGVDFNLFPPETSVISTDGYQTTYTNGYNVYKESFTNAFGISFQLVDSVTNQVIESGNNGILITDPNNSNKAQFTSNSINFSSIVGLSDYRIVLLDSTTQSNYGGFNIVSVNSDNDVLTIKKVLYNEVTLPQILRADIDGDFNITNNDIDLLNSYIARKTSFLSSSLSYPAPTTNAFDKIGKTFNILKLSVESFIDRSDDYSNSLSNRFLIHSLPDILIEQPSLFSLSVYNNSIEMSVEKQLSWSDYLLITNAKSRLVSTYYYDQVSSEKCSEKINCVRYSDLEFDPGSNDYFIPNNLILGSGDIKNTDGSFYKVDFEVGTIILEIPGGLFSSEKTLNIVDDFIADYSGHGVTRLGFPAMKFADCSYVTQDSLSKDQIRLSVSVQSFSPNLEGTYEDGYGEDVSGIVVDGKIGVSMDYSTGFLTLNFTNLSKDLIFKTLSTKIQINVFLKKGGFNNSAIFIDSDKVKNMLQLINIFPSPPSSPSSLINLTTDVEDILPVIYGGTGLNTVGANGTVLTSNGSSLSYQFITDLSSFISSTNGAIDADKAIKTDANGMLDPSFLYKNPIYIYGFAGLESTSTDIPQTIGAFSFKLSDFILNGISSIRFEAILESSDVLRNARIRLYNVIDGVYLELIGPSTEMLSNSILPNLLRSDDLQSQLASGPTDYIYEIRLSLESGGGPPLATCKMARLALEFANP